MAFLALMFAFFAAPVRAEKVSARVEQVTIPTWEIGPPQVHSVFSDPKHDIYPHTLNEILTDNKVDKTYTGVYLENEYVKLLILPEIGGRLHGALDKTNDYVWLYWQPTIKPGLISMSGAWISGGIEWNFPHGHRPSGFMPVDYRVIEHADGSATVWVGETEPIYRMRWLVGMTLFPGRSYVRCDYVLINPTSLKHPFQFWATAATHANEWAQAQFPGDMVTGHGKDQFWNWPVHEGVDLTWWTNSPNASSYFAFNNDSDWFGTYDHKVQGGTVHVADHHIMPGKKLWTWGSGPSGRIWEDILSEGGGPYFEPQAGAWSDNQPDYHWMWPNEVKTAHDYWYPVRETRGFHSATKDFALNTDLTDGRAFAGVYSTSVAAGSRIVLKNTRDGATLDDSIADLSPDEPFTLEVPAGEKVTVYDLHLAVYNSEGNLLIDLQQEPPAEVELPEGFKEPEDPKDLNQDELYHAGEWLTRFERSEDAMIYFQEALERDPGNSRVNVEMGFLALNQGRWKAALDHLERALKRDADNSRIYYGKGLAFSGLGHFEEAYDQFYRATYGYDYFSPAYLNLARIDLRRGRYAAALARLEQAETQNSQFADIPALRAAAYRRMGRHQEALTAAEEALVEDPMHFMGGYEKLAALKALGKTYEPWKETWRSILRDAVQNYLELSSAYASTGFYEEADAVLAHFAGPDPNPAAYPMVNYLRGHYRQLQGGPLSPSRSGPRPSGSGIAAFYAAGAAGTARYVNPHRLEEIAALEAALARNPEDAHARLFLGNLLYAMGQRETGLEQWKRAVQSQDNLSLAWRNVGYAENELNHNPRAAYAAYQKVLRLDPQDARALLEMDQIAEKLQIPSEQRLDFLLAHNSAMESRGDLVARLADLRLEVGGEQNLKKAYQALKNTHFHTWEGKYDIHLAWVQVNQALGDLAAHKQDYGNALNYYRQAGEYPKNLEVAARTPDFRAHVNWKLAQVYQAMGNPDEAREHLQPILDEKYKNAHIGTYFRALAQKALGNQQAYRQLLEEVEAMGRKYISGSFEYRGRKQVIGHYLLSLVLQERGREGEANQELAKALELNPRAQRLAIREAQLDVARAHP
ncbi:MAG: DUF5107 domain-containing protein [Acidobacteriota bacterium]